ncbi:MAG: response regulator [Candidatus Thorarchaeota archaeon]|jgi:CheY-like chemotaxis protein
MKPIVILLVEDNPGDIRLTEEAFSTAKVSNEVHTVLDGEAALEFLEQRGQYSYAPRPDIILLDLKLPKIDGHEVLKRIKKNPKLRQIPVVILTASSAEEDILQTYELNGNCFITKPVDFSKFVEIVQAIENFWFSIVKLPGSSRV